MRSMPFGAVALSLVMVLSGCAMLPASGQTPGSPAPAVGDPTPAGQSSAPPAVDELELSPEGLGTLVIGSAPPSADDPAAMIHFDPDYCSVEGEEPWGQWVQHESYVDETGRAVFGAGVVDDVVTQVMVRDPRVPTDRGVRVGDPRTAVEAEYAGEFTTVGGPLSDLYVIDSSAGRLVIEVASTADADYWTSNGVEPDHVLWMSAKSKDYAPAHMAASEGPGPSCM